MGIKGAGEAGTIGATPATLNAITDALYRALRYPAYRHAGDAGSRMERHPDGQKFRLTVKPFFQPPVSYKRRNYIRMLLLDA